MILLPGKEFRKLLLQNSFKVPLFDYTAPVSKNFPTEMIVFSGMNRGEWEPRRKFLYPCKMR
jgi:hypothetical protein